MKVKVNKHFRFLLRLKDETYEAKLVDDRYEIKDGQTVLAFDKEDLDYIEDCVETVVEKSIPQTKKSKCRVAF